MTLAAVITFRGMDAGRIVVNAEDGEMKIHTLPRQKRNHRRIVRAIRKVRRRYTEAGDLEAVGEIEAGEVVIGALRRG